MTHVLFYIHIFHLLCNVLRASSTITSIFMRRNEQYVNVYSYLENIGDYNGHSLLRCTSKCLLNRDCSFLFHHSGINNCTLHLSGIKDLSQADNNSLISSPGWTYYEKYQDVHTDKDSCNSSAGFTYSTTLGFCYYVSQEVVMDFDEISSACAAMQSHLVRIDSAVKQETIATILENDQSDKVCIQGSDNNPAGIFKFDDGTPMTFLHWNTQLDQPDGETEHNLYLRKSFGYRWHDVGKVRLDLTCAYICEK